MTAESLERPAAGNSLHPIGLQTAWSAVKKTLQIVLIRRVGTIQEAAE
jgi:hypothetical protein